MSEEAEMIRRDLFTYGGIFTLSYMVFVWHFFSNAQVARAYTGMLSSAHHANAVPAAARDRSMPGADSSRLPTADTSSRNSASAKVQAGVPAAVQAEEQPYHYEPVPVHVDAAAQIAAYSTLMSDPDPEVARIARDAYASIVESR